MAVRGPACPHRSLTWWAPTSSEASKNCPSVVSPATPARPQRASPRGETSRVYLLSKVKSGRDRWRKALTREIPFGGEQHMCKVLKPSLMPHHPTSPAITPRRSRLGLVALPRATHTCPLAAPGLLAANVSPVRISIAPMSLDFPQNTAVAGWAGEPSRHRPAGGYGRGGSPLGLGSFF